MPELRGPEPDVAEELTAGHVAEQPTPERVALVDSAIGGDHPPGARHTPLRPVAPRRSRRPPAVILDDAGTEPALDLEFLVPTARELVRGFPRG
ncbi:hypothetical protein [Actinopolymorpha rutila]|uniref:Uncharacterized protein n=1 Tax=Actinopolymorpha rutila TaxID=446787 RepID=A0A852Z934_9ACTN|nr:hypothetical protein [Actinopolymorpha rutila]NYH88362.1 hypothetical protein [Actinopolymorpha rutila]